MSPYSIQPADITFKQLDEPPFEVELCEYWFVLLELGQESWSTAYEYPGPKFWVRRKHSVRRKAWIHDVECLEVQILDHDAEGSQTWEVTSFERVDRGYLRSYGTLWGDENSIKIKTWKDNDFETQWGEYDPGKPLCIADVGRWRWLDDRRFTDGNSSPIPPDVNPNGAGLWEVHIGDVMHYCLRVLEPEDNEEGIMVETFVNRQGRVMLFRRYNGSRWEYGSKRTLVDGEPREWTELLPDAPRLYYNDICFVLWDFSIPDIALQPGPSNET